MLQEVAHDNNFNSSETDQASMPLRIFASKSVSNLIQLQGKKNSLTETNLFTHSPIHLFTLKRAAFTLAEGATHVAHCDKSRRVAFTLAEVLITLGIIGVVAAITMPMVIQNYKKQVTVNKLKKVYSILGQVAQKSIADNGAIPIIEGETFDKNNIKEFFDTYWLPYFKGVEVFKNFEKVNLNDNSAVYRMMNGQLSEAVIFTSYADGRIFFSTSDGITIHINVMKWQPIYDNDGNEIDSRAVFNTLQHVFVDINGIQPPNTFGKDVFWYTIDFKEGIVRPIGYTRGYEYVNTECPLDGTTCAAKIMQDGWKINYSL